MPEPTNPSGRPTGGPSGRPSAVQPRAGQPSAGRDAAGLRSLFEAELRGARVDGPEFPLTDLDRERLYAMWESHQDQRDTLRAAALELPEEPSFMLKPTLPGGGTS